MIAARCHHRGVSSSLCDHGQSSIGRTRNSNRWRLCGALSLCGDKRRSSRSYRLLRRHVPATSAASARPFDGAKPELLFCRHSHVVVYFKLAQQCFSKWRGKQLLYSAWDFTTFRRNDARKHCKTRMKHQKTQPKHCDLRMKRRS